MNKKKIFKGIALINFVVLMILFLLYRNGSFDHFLFNKPKSNLTSSNGGTPAKTTDSIPKKINIADMERLSSSKTIILVDQVSRKADTSKFKIDTTVILPKKRLMYGSKSGIIVEPKIFITDSTKALFDKYKGKQQK